MKPSQWYGAALVMPVIGIFMAVMEANRVADARLRNPVPAMGAFVSAKCDTYTRRGRVQPSGRGADSTTMSATAQSSANADGRRATASVRLFTRAVQPLASQRKPSPLAACLGARASPSG